MFTGLEKVSFHSNPKERQCQKMHKLPHNCIHLKVLTYYYAGQEATVRTGQLEHGTTDWFQIGKSVCQSYIVTLLI